MYCGRSLTGAEALERGYGRHCGRMHGRHWGRKHGCVDRVRTRYTAAERRYLRHGQRMLFADA